MELLHLKYFQTVAKTQHMTNAAKKLHIVQPALSRIINSLEKEIGVDLFDRNGKKIILNSNGEMFLKAVNESLSILENGVKELLDTNNQSKPEIKLLVLAGSNTLPNLILNFKKAHPDTTFKLLQHDDGEIDYKNFDFCISSTLDEVHDPFSITLLEEELFIGMPSNHPLATKNAIFLEEIANENFISFQSNKPFRTISYSLCKYAGFNPTIVFESDVPSIVKQLIIAGLGISFIPEISWGIHADDSLKLLRVIDPVCKRYINISWHPDNYISKYAKEFRDFAVEYYSML